VFRCGHRERELRRERLPVDRELDLVLALHGSLVEGVTTKKRNKKKNKEAATADKRLNSKKALAYDKAQHVARLVAMGQSGGYLRKKGWGQRKFPRAGEGSMYLASGTLDLGAETLLGKLVGLVLGISEGESQRSGLLGPAWRHGHVQFRKGHNCEHFIVEWSAVLPFAG
jgi:hypothetical protein